mgnify:CR=1 FL=1
MNNSGEIYRLKFRAEGSLSFLFAENFCSSSTSGTRKDLERKLKMISRGEQTKKRKKKIHRNGKKYREKQRTGEKGIPFRRTNYRNVLFFFITPFFFNHEFDQILFIFFFALCLKNYKRHINKRKKR